MAEHIYTLDGDTFHPTHWAGSPWSATSQHGGPPNALFMRAAELYQQRYSGPDNRINATFEIIYLHGWAPHESQQKPLRPGSAEQRLANALDTEERPADETPETYKKS